MTNRDEQHIALVKGGGDLGTGVVLKLHQRGYQVVVTELPQPLVVRRMVAAASAVYEGHITVESVTACRAQDVAGILGAWAAGQVPVIVDPEARIAREVKPSVVVDAIMAKRNTGTTMADAPIIIALGPGFYAGRDCHAVVETQRGPDLGRVYLSGPTAPDSGVPGEVRGETVRRVVRTPVSGTFVGVKRIGDRVRAGDRVGQVDGTPVMVALTGIVRGLIADGVEVQAGMKIGDVDPHGDPAACYHVSDKAWKVGEGVWQAVEVLNREPHRA